MDIYEYQIVWEIHKNMVGKIKVCAQHRIFFYSKGEWQWSCQLFI